MNSKYQTALGTAGILFIVMLCFGYWRSLQKKLQLQAREPVVSEASQGSVMPTQAEMHDAEGKSNVLLKFHNPKIRRILKDLDCLARPESAHCDNNLSKVDRSPSFYSDRLSLQIRLQTRRLAMEIENEIKQGQHSQSNDNEVRELSEALGNSPSEETKLAALELAQVLRDENLLIKIVQMALEHGVSQTLAEEALLALPTRAEAFSVLQNVILHANPTVQQSIARHLGRFLSEQNQSVVRSWLQTPQVSQGAKESIRLQLEEQARFRSLAL